MVAHKTEMRPQEKGEEKFRPKLNCEFLSACRRDEEKEAMLHVFFASRACLGLEPREFGFRRKIWSDESAKGG